MKEQVFKPKSFRLQSPSLSRNDRNVLCIIRKKEEAVKDPRDPSCSCSFLSFMHKPCLSPTSHTHWEDVAPGQPTPWPWLGCTGCCDPDMVRGPRGFFDLCLLVLDFVSQSSLWERAYCPQARIPFLPVFWPLREMRWINMKLYIKGSVDFLHQCRPSPVLGWVQCQALGHHSDEAQVPPCVQ